MLFKFDIYKRVICLGICCLLSLVVLPSQAEQKPPEYMQSLIDGYAIGEISVKTLNRICMNGTVRPSDTDNVKIMRGQNRQFCDSYIGSLLDIATTSVKRCSGKPDRGILQESIRKAASESASAEQDAARFLLGGVLKCVP